MPTWVHRSRYDFGVGVPVSMYLCSKFFKCPFNVFHRFDDGFLNLLDSSITNVCQRGNEACSNIQTTFSTLVKYTSESLCNAFMRSCGVPTMRANFIFSVCVQFSASCFQTFLTTAFGPMISVLPSSWLSIVRAVIVLPSPMSINRPMWGLTLLSPTSRCW